MRPQVASRCFGMLMGHQSRLNPFRYTATYPKRVADLPFDERMREAPRPERAGDDPRRGRRSTTGAPDMDRLTPDQFAHLFPLGRRPRLRADAPTRSVAAIAARDRRTTRGRSRTTCMLGADGREFLLLPLLNYGGGSYDGLHEMMSDPMTVQGLGDGGAHCGIVCDASMTTYLLTHWVRDRTRGPRLPLESAVQRLTHDTAAALRPRTTGASSSPGERADVNVIDFDALRLALPRAGARPARRRRSARPARPTATSRRSCGRDRRRRRRAHRRLPGRLVRGGRERG